jgi:hypothetical protein
LCPSPFGFMPLTTWDGECRVSTRQPYMRPCMPGWINTFHHTPKGMVYMAHFAPRHIPSAIRACMTAHINVCENANNYVYIAPSW